MLAAAKKKLGVKATPSSNIRPKGSGGIPKNDAFLNQAQLKFKAVVTLSWIFFSGVLN